MIVSAQSSTLRLMPSPGNILGPGGARLPNLLTKYSNLTEAWGVYSAAGKAGVNLLKVRNTNSGTTTVLQSAANGFIDNAAATTAQGSDTLAVTEVYGQVSGSVVAEQTTSANQPLLVKNPATGIWEIQYGDINGSWNRYLNLKNVSLSKKNAFILTLGRAWQNYTDNAHLPNWPSFNFNNNPTSTYQHGVVGRGLFKTLAWYYDNAHSNQTVAAPMPWDCRTSAVALSRTGGIIKVKRYPDAEYSADLSATGENTLDQTYIIGKDGFAAGDSGVGGSHYTQLMAIGTYVADVTRDAIALDFYKTMTSASAWPSRGVWFFGDSLFDGYQVSDPGHRNADNGVPIRVQNLLDGTYLCRCLARAGYKVADIATERSTYFDGSAKESTGFTHDAVVLIGANDIVGGSNAATTYAAIKTFYTNVKSGGANKMFLCTVPIGPGWTGGNASNLATLNMSIAASVTDGAADVFIDLANVIGTGAGAYQSDGIHLNAASVNTVASTIATAVAANF